MYKIIGADQKEYGPVPVEQIKDWIRQGRLTGSSRVQAEGSADWKGLSEIPEFAEALASAPPLAAPPPPAVSSVPAAAGKTSSMAIVGLILAVLGLPTCGLGAVAGLVLGILALVKINSSAGALRGRGLAIAAIVVSAVSLVVLPAAMLMPALMKAKGKAQAIVCMNNGKQLGLALMMYGTDNQDQYPAANKWCDAVSKYVGSSAVFKCVAAMNAERCNYAFNAKLGGLPLKQVRVPAQTVLAFETEGGWNQAGGPELLVQTPRHNGAVVLVFADGHVELVRQARLESLRWEP